MFKLPFRIARWAIYIRSICSLVLLKIFWNFRSTSKKRSTVRSYRFQLFYKVGILKKSGKNKKTAVLELLFKEVSKNKETPSQVFYWEFCETLKNTYFAMEMEFIFKKVVYCRLSRKGFWMASCKWILIWRKIYSIKLSRNGHQKVFLSIYWRNI